jgi:hypothetical protein
VSATTKKIRTAWRKIYCGFYDLQFPKELNKTEKQKKEIKHFSRLGFDSKTRKFIRRIKARKFVEPPKLSLKLKCVIDEKL